MLKHAELTEKTIGVFYEVYNELGFGFLESIYRTAMSIALQAKGMRVQIKVPVPVAFRKEVIGVFEADMMVEETVLLELKGVQTLAPAHEAQLLNYLRATPIEVGLLFNFGPKPQFKRLIFDNERKQLRPPINAE